MSSPSSHSSHHHSSPGWKWLLSVCRCMASEVKQTLHVKSRPASCQVQRCAGTDRTQLRPVGTNGTGESLLRSGRGAQGDHPAHGLFHKCLPFFCKKVSHETQGSPVLIKLMQFCQVSMKHLLCAGVWDEDGDSMNTVIRQLLTR